MTHVGHAQDRPRVRCRHLGAEAIAARQGATGVAAAVHALGIQGVGGQVTDPHQYVIGFGHGDAQLVDLDRVHRLAIGGNDRELQARNAKIEVAHRRAVDQAQAHGVAGLEQAGEVTVRWLAVEQVGVGGGADVGKVGGAHAHGGPGLALGDGLPPAVAGDIVDEVTDGALVIVEGVRLLFQGRHQLGGGLVAPVAEQQHVVALIAMGFGLFGFDDDRPVDPGLLLQAGMAVVPVGAALRQGKPVEVLATGFDAGKAQARHPVHVGREDDPVPVQRGRLAQAVAHAQCHGVAFTPAQGRAGQAVVDGQGRARAASDVHRRLTDKQLEVLAAQFIAEHRRCGKRRQAPEAETGQGAAGGKALDEGAAGRVSKHGCHSRGWDGTTLASTDCQ
ncbi:hypothetical protein D3C80_652510 [compost metagenome]